ncbi:MAG: hypothetical protein J6S29_05400 [Methanosphaera sp.]|nr:hypothetical protein [Methanosphaera sp.]
MQDKICELFGQFVGATYLEDKWKAIYEYLADHTVQETLNYFGKGVIDLVLDYVEGV